MSRLELVAPSEKVSQDHIDEVCRYIQHSRYLEEVALYTVKMDKRRSTMTNPRERAYLQQLQQACARNLSVKCHVKSVPTGDPYVLCDSLTTTVAEGRYYRHLALDGLLLEGISRNDITQLAFDLGWDRSVHVCLFKEIPQALLNVLLPKLARTPLQTLRVVYDPSIGGARRLKDAHPIDWHFLAELIKNRRLSTLQRIYLGHVRFQKESTRQLTQALAKSKSMRQLELALCQFERGTGRLFNALVEDSKERAITLKEIDFHYPILGCPNQPPPPPQQHQATRSGGYNSSPSFQSSFLTTSSDISSEASSSYMSPQFKPSAISSRYKR